MTPSTNHARKEPPQRMRFFQILDFIAVFCAIPHLMILRISLLSIGAALAVIGQSSDSFTLINADTDQPVTGFDPILDGAVINTADTGSSLNIRANTTPNPTGSVRFRLTGATAADSLESTAPYALFGDQPVGNYTSGTLNAGQHELTGTPYTAGNGGGTAGPPLTVSFAVSTDSTPSFSVNAGADRSVTLPENSITLTATPANGTASTYSWSQISGPDDASLSGESTSTLTAAGLIEGSYIFEISAVTASSSVATDRVTVTVHPASTGTPTSPVISGEQKRWHVITLAATGPVTSETSIPNPFADYRLEATFTHIASGKSYRIPGYYAADGNAAETSATSGDQWHVLFVPDETGGWTYNLSFRTGTDVAVAADPAQGAPGGYFHGASGTLQVTETDKTAPDLRFEGRLEYLGEHHLRFAGTGRYFMKCGPDAPENLLAYEDFDDTPNDMQGPEKGHNLRKSWSPHQIDYNPTSMAPFTWQGGKGSELFGAVRYLASEGLNSFSFLTFSLDGDDDNVFPHLLTTDVAAFEAVSDPRRWREKAVFHDRFDVSKMSQWGRIFSYGGTQGMFLHFKLGETENNGRMDGGDLGRERILYYRELVARFGNNLALNWNVGEENVNSEAQRKQFAAWFAANDPYRHPVVIHTFPGQKQDVYPPLLGFTSDYHGTSLQGSNGAFAETFAETFEWVTRSNAAGKKWVVAYDEPGDAGASLRLDDKYDADGDGLPDNAAGNSHTNARKNALWANPMAGGAGLEWYFGYLFAQSDLTCQDFRSRDDFWDVCRHFLRFWNASGAPFRSMTNRNDLISSAGANANRCLAKPGDQYVAYLYSGDNAANGGIELDLSDTTESFTVRWFDPRNGGFSDGSITSVTGGGPVNLGSAPGASISDWVVHLVANPPEPSVLFIRGADRSGGFLEARDDDSRTEQLAGIENDSTSGGNHGWSQLRSALVQAGYLVSQISETAENKSGPSQGIAVDLAALDLSQWEVIVFGSNNATYSQESVDALENWIRIEGGGALFISDGNFGGSWKDAPDSDQQFLSRFGLVVNQDLGTYTLQRSAGDFPSPDHPLLKDVNEFDGEGVSPFRLGALEVPMGTTLTRVAAAKGSTRQNNGTDPAAGYQGTARQVTTSDASLVAIDAGAGRAVGFYDRNTFFNQNGAGTNITRFDNLRLALNIFGWLSQRVEPVSPYRAFQQTNFADLPGGPANSSASATADPDSDNIPNAIEYALGTDPRSVTPQASAPRLENNSFVFQTAVPFPTDLKLVIQTSETLLVWDDVATKAPGMPWSGPILQSGNLISLPFASEPEIFYRLWVPPGL